MLFLLMIKLNRFFKKDDERDENEEESKGLYWILRTILYLPMLIGLAISMILEGILKSIWRLFKKDDDE